MEKIIDFSSQVEVQLKQLNRMIEVTGKTLARYKTTPKGSVRVKKARNGQQYYVRLAGEKKYKYIHADKLDLVKEMIQRDYYSKLYKRLRNQKAALESLKRRYDVSGITGAYEELSYGRKKFVEPLIMPDDEYIRKWKLSFPGRENGFRDKLIFETEQGEMVRSKSEKIIADMLKKYGVPYVYEPYYRTNSGKECFPDFATLNVRTRETAFWEHLGKAGEYSYEERNLPKIRDYEDDGVYCGEQLILTVESKTMPIDVKTIEHKIRMHLL